MIAPARPSYKKRLVYHVEPPDVSRETPVAYYRYAARRFQELCGRAPSRYTLTKYIHNMPGFPVTRGGPYVEVPVYYELKAVKTTEEAMERFFQRVMELERELGIHDTRKSA